MKLTKKTMLAASLGVAVIFAPMQAFGEDIPSYIQAAVDSSERPKADVSRDVGRKPAAILTFAGIKPGMTILDVNSGSGYYSEILSVTVGDAGKVYAHNGSVYWDFVKANIKQRYDGRLSNVTLVHTGREEIDLAEGSIDVAIAALAYHDYWYVHPARSAPEDIIGINKTVLKALKPGGHYIIIDHIGPKGSDAELINSLHRIDPAIVQKQMEEAGFRLLETSDILHNPDDPADASPFRQGFRFKTNRFVYKFVKE